MNYLKMISGQLSFTLFAAVLLSYLTLEINGLMLRCHQQCIYKIPQVSRL